MEDYKAYRSAARDGISRAECEPVLVEDFPSAPYSPRTACLDGVASCDALLLIIGNRGGWIAPSGKLVVEEELEEARRRGLYVFVFIQDTNRDEAAKRLVKTVSDYVHGFYRRTFRSPADLVRLVEDATKNLDIPNEGHAMQVFNDAFSKAHIINDEACVRFMLVPIRKDELLDPVSLETTELKDQILELAHAREIRLFSYERAKSVTVTVDSMVLHQTDVRGRGQIDEVLLEITSEGAIRIDANVTNLGLPESDVSMNSYYVIVEEDILIRLTASFALCRVFFDSRDPYRRHEQFIYNATLQQVGHRSIVQDRPAGQTSYSVGFDDDTPVIAFDQPRQTNRTTINSPQPEIDAIVTMFRRRLDQRRRF